MIKQKTKALNKTKMVGTSQNLIMESTRYEISEFINLQQNFEQ